MSERIMTITTNKIKFRKCQRTAEDFGNGILINRLHGMCYSVTLNHRFIPPADC